MNKKITTLTGHLERCKQAGLLEKFLNSVFDMQGLPRFDLGRRFGHGINCHISSEYSARFLMKYF